ncbi:MAG: site-2 protease family protein [Candidatus Kerfeldbacteria bacterium]|nr:site-2 protease family protein [Candidatus Kerfeldbacteria bacterium]
MTLLLFILILSLLVFVHELGHFLAARRFGIGVLEFGFGFPPRLRGWRRGQTLWSINLIPFGGFVRLEGETDRQSSSPTSFAQASWAKKFVILAAGVLMNYVLAWLLLSIVLSVGVTVDPTTIGRDSYQRLTQRRLEAFVSPGGSAAAAGLRSGDTIESINGQTFVSTDSLIAYARSQDYPPLTIVFRPASGPSRTAMINPRAASGTDRPLYGFGLQSLATIRYPWYVTPFFGLKQTLSLTNQTWKGIAQLARELVVSGRVSQDLTGPVGIAVLIGEIRQLGLLAVLQFVAILSISLAVINFLPLPALDGGRAVFAVVEQIRGRPLSSRWEQAIHAAGFYLILLLLIIISIHDAQRFNLFQRLFRLDQ